MRAAAMVLLTLLDLAVVAAIGINVVIIGQFRSFIALWAVTLGVFWLVGRLEGGIRY